MQLSAVDRRVIALAVPALGTLAIEPLYILVDTAIVGRLGTDPLAGLAIAATVLLVVMSVVGFMQYGVTPEVAHRVGAGDRAGARIVATDSTWLAVMLGLPATLVMVAVARPLSIALGAHGAVLDAATTYLRISAVGVPFIFITLVGHGVMRGYNDLRKPLIIELVANALNVVIEIVVVYGFHAGVAGSAWSTVVVQIGAACAFAFVLREHLAVIRPAWLRMKPLLIKGTHLGIRVVAMLAVWITATKVAANVDTPTLAANQVLFQLFTFLAMVLDALAIPAQSLVAGAMGAGDRPGAIEVGRSSTRLSLWVGVVFCVVLAGASPLVARVFTADPSVVSRITAGLLFLAAMQIPGAVAFALDGALIGGQDAKFLGRAAVFNLVVYVPFLIVTLVHPAVGIAGLWGGQLAWMITRALVNRRRFDSGHWMPAPTMSTTASANE